MISLCDWLRHLLAMSFIGNAIANLVFAKFLLAEYLT